MIYFCINMMHVLCTSFKCIIISVFKHCKKKKFCIHTHTVTQGEPHDGWLYSMITEIIADHNSTIECFYRIVHAQKPATLARLLPEQPTKLIPSEINYPWHSCITGESSRYINYHLTIIILLDKLCR